MKKLRRHGIVALLALLLALSMMPIMGGSALAQPTRTCTQTGGQNNTVTCKAINVLNFEEVINIKVNKVLTDWQLVRIHDIQVHDIEVLNVCKSAADNNSQASTECLKITQNDIFVFLSGIPVTVLQECGSLAGFTFCKIS